jgi:opacity protein-like surface antigen
MSAGVNADFMALFRSTEIDGQTSKYNRTGGGFGVFFDATYAEIGLGLDFANGKDPDVSDNKGFDATFFSISLLGKYPIALSEKLAFFPLLGFDWNIFTNGENKNTNVETKRDDLPDDYKDLNDLFLINLGVGADYALNDKLYVRGSFLYGFKLNSKQQQEYVDDYDAKYFTSGPTLKIGVGYKF